MTSYSFRKVTRADFPRLLDWLASPHIDGGGGKLNFEVRLIESDLGSPRIDMRIAEFRGVPFAYVQDYRVHEYGGPQFDGFANDARATDTFLGEPSFVGKGHGAGYIAARAQELLDAGAPMVAVDPDPANCRAIAAYKKAGFVPGDIRPCEDGDPVLVMHCTTPSLCSEIRAGVN